MKQRHLRFLCEEKIGGFGRKVLLVLDNLLRPIEDFATSQDC